jgi:hypothetical protein
MPTIWIAVFLSVCTFGGAFAVVELSGDFANVAKAVYALTVLGLAAYLVTHDGDADDEFAPDHASSSVLEAPSKA